MHAWTLSWGCFKPLSMKGLSLSVVMALSTNATLSLQHTSVIIQNRLWLLLSNMGFIPKNYLKTLPESLNDYTFRWPEVLTTWELKLINSPTRYQYLTDDFLPKGTAEERYSTSAAFLSVKTRSRSSATPTIGSNTSAGDDLSESASTSSKSAQTSTPQNTPHLPPNAQNAMYACEMLCRGIYSRHSINLLVVDDLVVPWWYDRQNAIQTNGLNFVRDAPHFVALIVLLQRFGMEDWGVEADLAPPSMFLKRSADLEPVVVNFGGDLKAEVQRSKDNYLHLPGLILKGRATTVIDATSNSIDPLTKTSLNGKRIVVKVYWPETWRLDEPYIISEARLRLEKSSLISNIPHLIASREISSSNTGNVTREFGLESAPQGSNARVLRILLFPRLVPMDEMTNEDTIIHAWFDCFECHYALWKNGIEHGDISVWNLMWDNTNMCGVLNDWDLAHIQGSIGRGHERTGTLPFMARDLLTNQKRPVKGDNKPIQRLYRHEVESFIWVFTWMCAKDDIPDEINQWRKGDNAQIRNAKDGFLYRFYEFEVSKKSWDKCQLLLYLLAKIGFDVGFRREHRVPDDQGIHDIVLAIMRNEVISVDGVDDFILKSKK
ncbi:hypothetical protein BDQ17DRAFT_1463752 [Cyathus striatus]|nr:hypothetical protein BDQ17DRAFT_1463752 [Cyathus striatus]